MAIDFTLTDDQRKLQLEARDFAENVLAPVVREADAESDPLRAFQMTKAPYVDAYKRGIAYCMLPAEYGGGGKPAICSSKTRSGRASSASAAPRA